MIIFTAIQSVLLIGLPYVLIQQYGIIGVTWGWIATYCIMMVLIAADAKKNKWL